MSSILPYLVLLLTASACARGADDNAKEKAHTMAITKANDAYDYLLQNKVKVGKLELENSILCVNKLKESLEKLVEVKDFDAAIKSQQGCANAIKTTSGVMGDVKAKVEAAVKAIQAVNAPSNNNAPANTATKAQNHAAIKAAEAYLWLAGQKDNVVESEQGLADKCAESIATSIRVINEGDYKSAINNLSACANSLQGNQLPVLKDRTTEALSACKAIEASTVAVPPQQSKAQKDPEMVADEAYMWLQNSDNTDKLGKPEKEAVEKCTSYIASSIDEIHSKEYKKAIDSLLNCANSTLKGQLLPEVYKKSMEAANLCQALKRINAKVNQPAAAPSSDAATAPPPSDDDELASDAPTSSSDGSDSSAPSPSDGSDNSPAPEPSADGSDDSSALSDGSEDSAAPTPSSDDSPARAPSEDDSPAPVTSEDDSPAPSPSVDSDDSTAQADGSDNSAAPSPSEGSDDSAAQGPSCDDSPAPAPSGDDSPAPATSGDDSPAPSPSEGSDDSTAPADASDDSAAPSPSEGSDDSAAPSPSEGSEDSAAPADGSDAPAPSEGSDDSNAPAPSPDGSNDSAAPAPSEGSDSSGAKDTEAQKEATKEVDAAFLIINDNRPELEKLDPNGTDACHKSLSAAMTNIAEDVYDKTQSELQECVNALPSPKGHLVDVKAKAEKAIENLKAQ